MKSSVNKIQSPKSGLVTFVLCFFFGTLGIHRFYVGKIGTGILMLLTAGGFGFWYLYDLISIVSHNFYDKEDRIVTISEDPTNAKKVLMVVLAFFGGLIILFIIFVVAVSIYLSPMASLGKQELSELRNNNIQKAYELTSSEFRDAVSIQEFKQFLKRYPELTSHVDASFPERQEKDGYGRIIGALKLKDGTEVPIEMQFIKEEGQWKILGIGVRNLDRDGDDSRDQDD